MMKINSMKIFQCCDCLYGMGSEKLIDSFIFVASRVLDSQARWTFSSLRQPFARRRYAYVSFEVSDPLSSLIQLYVQQHAAKMNWDGRGKTLYYFNITAHKFASRNFEIRRIVVQQSGYFRSCFTNLAYKRMYTGQLLTGHNVRYVLNNFKWNRISSGSKERQQYSLPTSSP